MTVPTSKGSALVRDLLNARSVPELEDVLSDVPAEDQGDWKELYSEITAMRDTLKNFSGGNFDEQIVHRGAVAGYLKTLQANLRHLAWQVEQVAEGDFSQRVDFMGNFSRAFNKMTSQLERLLAESKEREAYERTRIMLDATPLCCCFWNENLQRIDCNLEAVKLFDLKSKQEFLDRFDELFPEFQPNGLRSTELVEKHLRDAFSKGRLEIQWMHQKPDGEPIPSEISLVRVRQNDRDIVLSYIRDLRELKKTQTALERERLLLLDILNTSPVCFTILVDGKARFVTPFMREFLGIEVGEILTDYFSSHDHADPVATDSDIPWRPVSVRTKTGETKEMLASFHRTDYYDEKGIMAWLVDVTEIRKVQDDLRVARDKAEELARVKGEFLANMSHEIRTPMNAILGMMHLIQQTELSDKQAVYIETTEKSAKLLLRIINDILDFSKIEAGKMTMESRIFLLSGTIRDAVYLVEESARKKRIKLSCDIPSDLPKTVVGDAVRLKQVLLNLLNNAIKFTSSGEVRLKVAVQDRDEAGITLHFTVCDTGIGLTPGQRENLFLPFTQADNTMSRKYGGTGLGLAICKNLVGMMGGEIWCQSREGEGSTFEFTAMFEWSSCGKPTENRSGGPRAPELGEADRYVDEEIGLQIPESLQGIPILLAEDNKINQLVAVELLKLKGFSVDIAPNGRRAVEMIRNKFYAIVLMDIQMPEMDGLEATREVRRDPRFARLPIVAMTANAMSGDRELCLAAGMNDHIAKPIDPNSLYRSIIRWVDSQLAPTD